MTLQKIDPDGSLITVDIDGLARLDGVPMFRLVEREHVIYFQFMDRDRMRAQCRGTKFVEVPLNVIVAKLNQQANNGQ